MADHADIDHSGLTGVPGSNPQFTTIELGHASDTTLSRVSAGVVAIEGTNIVKAGAVTSSGLTQATARILGRTTASTGAVEEITVGSGLSLSAGSLTATGGGAVPDCKEAYLGADVTMVNADTWYDGPSISLGAGTWEIEGQLTSTDANANVTGIVARLSDGSTHYSSRGSHKPAGSGVQHIVTVNARVTLGSTTTVKLQGSSARGSSSSVIKTTGVLTGEIANKATRIRAIAVTSI